MIPLKQDHLKRVKILLKLILELLNFEDKRKQSIKDEFSLAKDLLKMKLSDEELEQETIEETMKNTLYNKCVGKCGDEEDEDDDSGSEY